MSDFKPTHVSIGGVKMNAHQYGNADWHFEDAETQGGVCDKNIFAALFEPIESEVMVPIPMDVARYVACVPNVSPYARERIFYAISACEREEAS